MTASKDHFLQTAPHMVAKHALLSGYLVAWFSILTNSKFHELLYVDGFAGPGRFEDGTDGSPLRVLRLAKGLSIRPDKRLCFRFIEKNKAFADRLEKLEIPTLELPANFDCSVRCGEFEDEFPRILAEAATQDAGELPVFSFIDPFGVKGLPFDLIRRLLARPHSEVFVTFMHTGVLRCLEQHPHHINALMGSDDAATFVASSTNKLAAARLLYREALRSTGAHVCYFQMRDRRNRALYDLFFATKSELGLVKMKEAMWKVDRSGYLLFSDARDSAQQEAFSEDPGKRFALELWENFRGQRVEIAAVDRYATLHPTFLQKHARSALCAMEGTEGSVGRRVMVCRAPCRGGRKASVRQFPAGTTVDFLE